MGMQRTPLVMSRLIDRGAAVAPETEIVTATETGTRRRGSADARHGSKDGGSMPTRAADR